MTGVARIPSPRSRALATLSVREIKFGTLPSTGERAAWIRFRNGRSLTWAPIPISRADRAIATGSLTFGGWSGPCVEYREHDLPPAA